jgi:hypothetical protein
MISGVQPQQDTQQQSVETENKIKEAINFLAQPSINSIIRGLNFLIPKTCDVDKETLLIENYPVY